MRPLTRDKLLQAVKAWRSAGESIAFVNGCFDGVLHPGHVRLLSVARQQCDRLVVAVNSDAYCFFIKGPDRPFLREGDRAANAAEAANADACVIFDDDTPADLLAIIQPDVYVMGEEYRHCNATDCGSILYVPRLDGFSTTACGTPPRKVSE